MPNPTQALELEKFLPYRLSVLAQVVSESLHDLYASPFGLAMWTITSSSCAYADDEITTSRLPENVFTMTSCIGMASAASGDASR